jgi:transposase InsO family protein
VSAVSAAAEASRDDAVAESPSEPAEGLLRHRLESRLHGDTPDRTRLTDAQMLALIRAIHAALKGAYGSPRMVRELRGRGVPASKERVERLMREHGIRARHKRRYKVTTDSTHHLPVAANLLNRDFTPSTPNQTWTSDITYRTPNQRSPPVWG